MLTPQEVAEHAFSKSAFGGYNMTMVDDFLDELTDDYTALYKENAALKAKMKVLVDKVEEYRATEDAMRAALLSAQKMASNMVSEAEEKKETLIADAEMEARAKIGALHDEIVDAQKRLNAVKAQTKQFIEQTRAVYESQIRALDTVPDLTPEQVSQTAKEAQAAQEAAADIAALGEKIVASYEQERAADTSATTVFPVAKVDHAAVDEDATVMFPATGAKKAELDTGEVPLADTAKHLFKLADLKFGRNYNSEGEA
ncbi:MAG: DivIVA domain-containing protein [Oscillospiraceae bacterium]|nr:DivIVA domain-containing protein [Oscillospiraceae bacterium]